MTNTDLVEFKTIYPDIERYLAFDATDNNIEFAKKYALGTAVRGVDHIDAFDPEKDARQFAQLMSLCNGLVICD